jgi:carbon-monoxide dehydrogenase iron sulfur subunit
MLACLPGAIFRDHELDTVLIDADKCINCATCAMACPFGVIRYHEDTFAPSGKAIAVKCDNCNARQMEGLIPACVEICKVSALTFETPADALKRKTDEVARSVSVGAEKGELPPGYRLMHTIKKKQLDLRHL